MALMKELLDWKKLEPIYVRIYQKTFTQQEIDGMIAFYKTSAGQAVISKMPAAMQNTMDEMQGLMAPVMEKMQRMQQEVAAGDKGREQEQGRLSPGQAPESGNRLTDLSRTRSRRSRYRRTNPPGTTSPGPQRR